MAQRLRGINPVGPLAAILLIVLVLGTLGAVALHAGGLSGLNSWDWRAVWFTIWQAVVSATVSVLLAVPVARALARRSFPGRHVLITLLGAPFILPVIVAIMGLVSVFGRSGAVNEALSALGLPPVSIYGWQGVILAHVFFNLPLSVRMILHGWQAIPSERFRLAQSLGFNPVDIARHLERPMLREIAPGAWLAVFLVCLTSFAVALALGGGPKATTVELAIYQAFRFDFDMGKAAALGLIQVGLCLVALLLSSRVTIMAGFGTGMGRGTLITAPRGWYLWTDLLAILLAAAFLLVPMVSVILQGAPSIATLPATVWSAALRSIVMALISTGATLVLALALSLAVAQGQRWIEAAGMLPIVASPLVLGTGLYLMLRGLASPTQLALPVTVGINAAMALPFALRIMIPAARSLHADYGRLAASLGMTGLARLRLLTLPRLARPIGFAGGLAAALAMGDLGVITLFADSENATLPLRLYQLMNSYRMADAAACAVLLMAISFALFWLFDRGGRLNAEI
ncbi:thiamine/thiamine pyrophosphate ABC transporter permease ThiP [Paracoccus aerodenitrificans]|uniref:thiamine/thiamine pyrophosphate ABC transporter permease ThiP n=1 Tax=Paracoccus aerodenitrificans TaxID=3017781 RepID=UPI0022F003D7|nr:thiamine/thiamine pyrophosphate ABC transporter permease ThiP [Paracoccus aerodenitrificans]WBU64553.1 thiamine/thiamine pyrophosphate ABC transporter permease ThiP [Paracoccus aerodenitrificans]